MPSLPQEVLRYTGLIEAEMRRIGLWQSGPLKPEQLQFTQAFAIDTMAFSQWLQFVFLPRAREAAEADRLPRNSSVATQAIREFDGDAETGPLLSLLADFDSLFD